MQTMIQKFTSHLSGIKIFSEISMKRLFLKRLNCNQNEPVIEEAINGLAILILANDETRKFDVLY